MIWINFTLIKIKGTLIPLSYQLSCLQGLASSTTTATLCSASVSPTYAYCTYGYISYAVSGSGYSSGNW